MCKAYVVFVYILGMAAIAYLVVLPTLGEATTGMMQRLSAGQTSYTAYMLTLVLFSIATFVLLVFYPAWVIPIFFGKAYKENEHGQEN